METGGTEPGGNLQACGMETGCQGLPSVCPCLSRGDAHSAVTHTEERKTCSSPV